MAAFRRGKAVVVNIRGPGIMKTFYDVLPIPTNVKTWGLEEDQN